MLVLPNDAQKPSTASVYAAFDERNGAEGWDDRRAALLDALERVTASARPRRAAARTTSRRRRSPTS